MKKVLIIGGGVAGLSAGIYLKANGYDVEILEKNLEIGGACTGWERKGFYIDGCIHWLTGVNPNDSLYKLWTETRAITKDTKIFYQDELTKYVFEDKKTLTTYADLEKMEKSLLEFAPEDNKQIKKLIKQIRTFQTVNPPCNKPIELMNLKDLLNVARTMLFKLHLLKKASKMSCKDLAKKFKNPRLREVLAHFMAPNYNYMSMLYMLGHISAKDGGIPLGGSLAIAKRMENYFLELGGVVTKNAPVTKILVENDTAKGVILSSGSVKNSDWVISTTPLEHCLVDLLDNKYHDNKFDFRLKDQKTYPIYTYTVAVIKCPTNVSEKSLAVNVRLDEKIKMDTDYDTIAFRNYAYDDTVKAQEGYSVMQATIHGNDQMYFWWKDIKENGDYKATKKQIAERFLQIAKATFPDVANALEIIDVVTPCTYERYLNSRHGSFQGFIHTKSGKALMHNGRLKGLKNFILGGQWIIRSGGLPPAIMSGRFSAQRICHDDKKVFVTP